MNDTGLGGGGGGKAFKVMILITAWPGQGHETLHDIIKQIIPVLRILI